MNKELGQVTQSPELSPENNGQPMTTQSTLCKERMIEVISATEKTAAAAKSILEILNANPELDAQFCLVFGVQPRQTR